MTQEIQDRLQSSLSNRYEIRRELARGGMGRVFEARDVKHGRAVAIKVLDPEIGAAIGPKRFRAEIETAARLSHPHIVPLFDSGEAGDLFYFVMPLVMGESLRQKLIRERQLPIDDAVRVARQAADALQYAHGQGLIHRDVKPENILIAGRHALVFDFGIARSGAGEEGAPTRTLLPIGTPAYMSPEQIAGAPLDARTDQYSLACVVYEMLAGQPPFTGPSQDNVLAQHRTAQPRPIATLRASTPPHVSAALVRGLSKAPADRFRSLSEFADALVLRTSAQPAETDRVMLAVLPLDNLGADPEQEYFTEGMTEELIAHLGRIQPRRLGVIARTSAMRYKKTQKTVSEIGAELGVEFVLEGSVRRAGDRLRITTQLIQVSDQSHLWAETYDRRMADVFELQDEVASTVAKALELELVRSSRGRGLPATPNRGALWAAVPEAPTAPISPPPGPDPSVTNSAAYEAYLKGRFYWNKRTPDGMRLGIEWFQRSIALDPNFAPAHSGLSDAYNITLTYMVLPGDEAMRQSERAARRALELDPNLPEAKTSLAAVLGHLGHTAKAVEGIQRALEINPNYVPALYWGSIILATQGDFPGAFALVDRAHVLDPVSVIVNIVRGNLLSFLRREGEALGYFQEAVGFEPALTWPSLRTALCRAAIGQLDEALSALDALSPEARRSLDILTARCYVLGRMGRADEARTILREFEARSKTEHVSWERFAYAYLGLGEREPLRKLLEGVKVLGSIGRLSIRHEAAFDAIREDPMFSHIVERARKNEEDAPVSGAPAGAPR